MAKKTSTKKSKKPYETDELKADEKVKIKADFNQGLKKAFFSGKPEKKTTKK